MTMIQNLWHKANTSTNTVHGELVTAVGDILKHQRAEGATTGLLMKKIEATPLGARIDARAPRHQRIQYWKTIIGHALDELQDHGAVHCDCIGKRVMDGDQLSVPVWRTQEDWVAFAKAGRWMLSEHRRNGLPEYSERLRNHLKAWSPSLTNQTK